MSLKIPTGLEAPPVSRTETVQDKNKQLPENSDQTVKSVKSLEAPYGYKLDGTPRPKPGRKPKGDKNPIALKDRYVYHSGASGLGPSTHVKVFARPFTEEAVNTLVAIMRDKDAPVPARVSAATQVLDRAWGKPKETLELEAPVEGIRARLANVSSDDLRDLLRAVQGAAGARPVIDVTPVKAPALPDALPAKDKEKAP